MICLCVLFFKVVMLDNPEVSLNVTESPKVQQLLEYSKVGEDALMEQVTEISKTKKRIELI